MASAVLGPGRPRPSCIRLRRARALRGAYAFCPRPCRYPHCVRDAPIAALRRAHGRPSTRAGFSRDALADEIMQAHTLACSWMRSVHAKPLAQPSTYDTMRRGCSRTRAPCALAFTGPRTRCRTADGSNTAEMASHRRLTRCRSRLMLYPDRADDQRASLFSRRKGCFW